MAPVKMLGGVHYNNAKMAKDNCRKKGGQNPKIVGHW